MVLRHDQLRQTGRLCLVALCLCLSFQAWAEGDNATPAQGMATVDAPAGAVIPASAEPEPLIVHVTLNTAEVGDYFMMATPDHEVFAQKEVLKEIGLTGHLPGDDGKQELLSLRAMAPKVTYQLDSMAGTLAITADPTLFPTNTHQLQTRQPSTASLIQDSSLFLNYSVNYAKSRASKANYVAPLELGANWQGLSLINNFNWLKSQPITRTQSQLVYDDRNNLQRWMAGDIQASSGARIGSGALGGISLSKNYALMPSMFTGPPLELQAMLVTPSEVEVRIDGQQVFKDNFPAGPLDLTNIPYYRSGMGQAEIVVRDAFGRETVFNQAYYTSTSLLASGLHAYNYAAGVQQLRNNRGDLIYGNKPMFFGTHRYGLTDWFTPGYGLESDGSAVRGGLMADIVLGRLGQLGLVGVGSKRQGLKGAQLQLNYSYSGAGLISPSLFFTRQTLHYGGILDALTLTPAAPRWRGGAAVAAGLGRVGSLSGRWSRSQSFARLQGQDASLMFSTVLPGQVSLTTQFSRAWMQKSAPTNQANVSLGHSFSNGLYVSANYSYSNRSNSFGLQFQLSPPLGDGFGFSASANAPQQGDISSNERLQFRHQYGELDLGRSGTNKSPAYDARLSGSLLLADGGLHIGRPIRDSFALIKVEGMEHVKVKVQSQDVGETNAAGELMLPYLHAYTDNAVSIDPSVIPMGYTLDAGSKTVTTGYRSGGVVSFNVRKMHIVGGKAWYRRSGELETAQYSGLEYGEGKDKKSVIIGFGGEIYVENIPAGTYAARMFNEKSDCRFSLVIPETDDLINDIGDVVCNMDNVVKEEVHP